MHAGKDPQGLDGDGTFPVSHTTIFFLLRDSGLTPNPPPSSHQGERVWCHKPESLGLQSLAIVEWVNSLPIHFHISCGFCWKEATFDSRLGQFVGKAKEAFIFQHHQYCAAKVNLVLRKAFRWLALSIYTTGQSFSNGSLVHTLKKVCCKGCSVVRSAYIPWYHWRLCVLARNLKAIIMLSLKVISNQLKCYRF